MIWIHSSPWYKGSHRLQLLRLHNKFPKFPILVLQLWPLKVCQGQWVSNVGQDIKQKSVWHESHVPVTSKLEIRSRSHSVKCGSTSSSYPSCWTDRHTDRCINHHMSLFFGRGIINIFSILENKPIPKTFIVCNDMFFKNKLKYRPKMCKRYQFIHHHDIRAVIDCNIFASTVKILIVQSWFYHCDLWKKSRSPSSNWMKIKAYIQTHTDKQIIIYASSCGGA